MLEFGSMSPSVIAQIGLAYRIYTAALLAFVVRKVRVMRKAREMLAVRAPGDEDRHVDGALRTVSINKDANAIR